MQISLFERSQIFGSSDPTNSNLIQMPGNHLIKMKGPSRLIISKAHHQYAKLFIKFFLNKESKLKSLSYLERKIEISFTYCQKGKYL